MSSSNNLRGNVCVLFLFGQNFSTGFLFSNALSKIGDYWQTVYFCTWARCYHLLYPDESAQSCATLWVLLEVAKWHQTTLDFLKPRYDCVTSCKECMLCLPHCKTEVLTGIVCFVHNTINIGKTWVIQLFHQWCFFDNAGLWWQVCVKLFNSN